MIASFFFTLITAGLIVIAFINMRTDFSVSRGSLHISDAYFVEEVDERSHRSAHLFTVTIRHKSTFQKLKFNYLLPWGTSQKIKDVRMLVTEECSDSANLGTFYGCHVTTKLGFETRFSRLIGWLIVVGLMIFLTYGTLRICFPRDRCAYAD